MTVNVTCDSDDVLPRPPFVVAAFAQTRAQASITMPGREHFRIFESV